MKYADLHRPVVDLLAGWPLRSADPSTVSSSRGVSGSPGVPAMVMIEGGLRRECTHREDIACSICSSHVKSGGSSYFCRPVLQLSFF